MSNFLHVECPSCHSKYSVDRDELTKPRKVKCIDCGYQWIYTVTNYDKSIINSSENSNKLISESDREDDDRGDFDYNVEENKHTNKNIDDRQGEIDQEDTLSNLDIMDDEKNDDLDDLFSDLDVIKNNKISKRDFISNIDIKENHSDENVENDKEAKITNQDIEENENDDLDDLFLDLDEVKNAQLIKENKKEKIEEKANKEEEDEDLDDDTTSEEDEDLDDDTTSEEDEESIDKISEEDDKYDEDRNLIQKIIKYSAIGILIIILFVFIFSLGLNSYDVLPNNIKSILSTVGINNIDGLEIIDLKPKIIINRENSFNIIINGNIANLSNKKKEVPEIFIFIHDKHNNARKYSFRIEKKSLQPMEYQRFNYKIFAIDFEPIKVEVSLINDIGRYVLYK